MARLAIRLLGPFQVTLDEKPVTEFYSDKVRALLAYLAVESDRPHRRETLAGLLWPDYPEHSARQSLSQALFALRRALGEGGAFPAGEGAGSSFTVTRQTIQFNASGDCWVDAAAFGALLEACRQHHHPSLEACEACPERLQQAAGLYGADFLTGFSVGDSPEFEEWLVIRRERYRRLAAEILHSLAACHERRGEGPQGLACARRWVELEPLDEEGHRQLMRLLVLCGQRSAALAQYEACRRTLREELGVEPEPGTTALYEAIQEGRVMPLQAIGVVPAAPRHNLPVQPTRFVGRKGQLAQMAELLREPGCRLLTVVGAGGMGKTRLAIQAAEEQLGVFSDGVWFVPLASLESVELLASTIIEALGVLRHGSMDPHDQLLRVLGGRKVLLVLDNFEHLLEGTTLVTEVLREAPHLKVVVTSRERLNVRGEWLLPLGGMEYPEEEMAGVREEEYSALELFVQCARRVRPDFTLARAGASWVARICRLVEGMPLAIELAAPWVRVMGCEEIAREIEGGLGFLATTLRDVPPRHRSMRAVFDHSWGLLSDEERSVLRQLSVFRGGFRREAAEVVAEASLEVLSGLVDSSWLRATPSGRYEMHELIRQYGADKLDAEPAEEGQRESERVRDRHSRYYGAFPQEPEPHLFGWGQKEAFEEILEDMDNVWAAWRWALERGDVETIGRCVVPLEYVGEVSGWYHEVQQAFQEGAVRLRQQLDLTACEPEDPTREQAPVVLADILSQQAYLCFLLGLYERVIMLCEESLALLHDVEHDARRHRVRINAKMTLGWLFKRYGDSAQFKRLFREGLALAEEVGDSWGRERALFALGTYAARIDGRYAEAEVLLQRAIAIADETGEQWAKAACLDSLSWVLCAQGEYQRAERLAEESLQIRQELGDRVLIGYSWVRLGEIATALGNYELARRHFQRSFAITNEISNVEVKDADIKVESLIGQAALASALGQHEEAKRLCEDGLILASERRSFTLWAEFLVGLGQAMLALGEAQQARERFRQGLEAAMKAARLPTAVRALVGLACLSAEEGEPERAVELLSLVLHHPATRQIERDRAQHLLAELASKLPSDVFTAAVARGQARELEEVAAEILARQADAANGLLSGGWSGHST